MDLLVKFQLSEEHTVLATVFINIYLKEQMKEKFLGCIYPIVKFWKLGLPKVNIALLSSHWQHEHAIFELFNRIS